MVNPEIIAELETITGKDSVLTSREDPYSYSYDGTTSWSHMPDVVVLPTTGTQISQILRLANEHPGRGSTLQLATRKLYPSRANLRFEAML